jgi:hypothetical protein
MARPAFKPDSSFFRKIVVGAVGARAVAADLDAYGHEIVELERGSTDTKLWKEVKRKRVRIPDLVCKRCGQRIESRGKTRPELTLSHSPTDAERAWDFGMTDADWIAFPICSAVSDESWATSRLRGRASYWHERRWTEWEASGAINYATVRAFRNVSPASTSTKGVTEGSETSIGWDAVMATQAGMVSGIIDRRISVKFDSGRSYTWTAKAGHRIQVDPGQRVREYQVLAAAVSVLTDADKACPGDLNDSRLESLLHSRERTQRFTGVKLARLRSAQRHVTLVEDLAADEEEDIYVRLEALAYLAAVDHRPVRALFSPYLEPSRDEPTRLEAIIALADAATSDAVHLLSEVVDDALQPYFMRAAAAWSLGKVGDTESLERLVSAFGDLDPDLREEALNSIVPPGQASLADSVPWSAERRS